MMRKVLFSILMVLISLQCFAQRDNIWMLGYGNSSTILKPSLNFSSGSVDTFSFPRPMEFFITNSSISDTSGQLLFYTNGQYIENRFGDTLLNSNDFNTGWATDSFYTSGLGFSQATVTIPDPGNTNRYYVFHETGEALFDYQLIGDSTVYEDGQPFHLSYSVIDMTLDNGKGGIVPGNKNTYAVEDTLILGQISVCKHGNGRDWWILVHRYNSDLFYKFLVTPDGVSNPILQNIGNVLLPSNGIIDFDVLGQSKFSPDGTKFTMAGGSNILHLFDFDRCSGILSNYRNTLVDTLDRVIGCSFSPNSRYLYVSHVFNLYQYDTWNLNLDSAGTLVAQFDSFVDPFPTYFFGWQLGPDSKVYGNTWGSSRRFHIISEPDSFGIACNVLQHSLELPNYSITIPHFPNYNLGPLPGSPCDSLTSTGEIEDLPLQLSVSPNPTSSNSITIKYSLEQNTPGLIKIFDTKRKVVYSYPLPPWSSYQNLTLPNLTSGIYLMRLECGERSRVVKFVRY